MRWRASSLNKQHYIVVAERLFRNAKKRDKCRMLAERHPARFALGSTQAAEQEHCGQEESQLERLLAASEQSAGE